MAAVGAGLLGLLAVVALAAGNGRPRVGGTTDIAAVANVRDIVLTIGVTVYAFAIGLVLWALWSSRMRGGKLDRPSGIGSLLVFFALAAALAYGINNQPEPQQQLDELPLGPGEVVAPPRIPRFRRPTRSRRRSSGGSSRPASRLPGPPRSEPSCSCGAGVTRTPSWSRSRDTSWRLPSSRPWSRGRWTTCAARRIPGEP